MSWVVKLQNVWNLSVNWKFSFLTNSSIFRTSIKLSKVAISYDNAGRLLNYFDYCAACYGYYCLLVFPYMWGYNGLCHLCSILDFFFSCEICLRLVTGNSFCCYLFAGLVVVAGNVIGVGALLSWLSCSCFCLSIPVVVWTLDI